MSNSLCVPPDSVLVGWDFSTGAVKWVIYTLHGELLAEGRLPTDIWKGDPAQKEVAELSLLQLEGQVRCSLRAIAARLREERLLGCWIAGGLSATHHTAGRIDADFVQLRRAICWNDQTLLRYHERGLGRLGGRRRAVQLIGGPWAPRFTLSHLVKDEEELPPKDWYRTYRILPHGPLAAGYMTGNFAVISVSSAASTGIMDLRSCRWCYEMLEALGSEEYRGLAPRQLPQIIDHTVPIGPLADHVALEIGLTPNRRPLIFPTSDDQQAGLVGAGAVQPGHLAIILGTSTVVNSASDQLPSGQDLDVMRLNWGPYLWMRCYTNGAQVLKELFGEKPDYPLLERLARACPPGAGGTLLLPFHQPEACLGVTEEYRLRWSPEEPGDEGTRYRAALESIAYLVCLGVRAHEAAGQRIERITVSGGIARSDLMCEILASVLEQRLKRLESEEGPALGAAVTALAAMESRLRSERGVTEPFTVADAAAMLVKYRSPVDPRGEWVEAYRTGLEQFKLQLAATEARQRPLKELRLQRERRDLHPTAPPEQKQWVNRLVDLGLAVRRAIVEATRSGREDLTKVVSRDGPDVSFGLDKVAAGVVAREVARWPDELKPLLLIAEGIDDDHARFGDSQGPLRFRLIVDPIDGTRGLMYDKRSAWFVAAVAPGTDEAVRLSHTFAAVMLELPTTKQDRADAWTAVRGHGARRLRSELEGGETREAPFHASRETNVNEGFAQVTNFFPGTKELASQLMEEVIAAAADPGEPGKAKVFDDQYISTAGQLVELMVGHDRFGCDLRPIFQEIQGRASSGLTCHPYDIAGLLVAQEIKDGIILTDGRGKGLDPNLDVRENVHWCGYANEVLRTKIERVIHQWLRKHHAL